MLETPLYGRFGKENQRLVFGPTIWYDRFVNIVTGGGAFLLLDGLTGGLGGRVSIPITEEWCVLVGGLTLFAGILAHFSVVRISFDIKNGTYWRRQGPGILPRLTRGTLKDLDAVVMLAEPHTGSVTYHLVLHWKANREPFIVLQQDSRALYPGQPLQSGGGPLMQLGIQYAQSLGVKFFDNSHFPSRSPVPMF